MLARLVRPLALRVKAAFSSGPAEPRAGRNWRDPETVANLCLLFLLAGWALLACTVLDVGPSGLDPVSYVDEALRPGHFATRFQNRGVHILGIRIAYTLFEDGLVAARALSILCTWATMIGACLLGRRAGGYLVGTLAALFVPFVPSLVAHPNSLYPDPTCVAFAVTALACASGGSEGSGSVALRPTSIAGWIVAEGRWLAAGVACFLAFKAKEVGMGLVPGLAILAFASKRTGRVAIALFSGLALGWLGLALSDSFSQGDVLHSVRPTSYRLPNVSAALHNHNPGKLKKEYFGTLFVESPYLTTVGIIGLLFGGRKHLVLRAVGAWFVGTLLFMSFASWMFRGVSPQLRYLVCLHVPLAIGAAYLLGRSIVRIRQWSLGWREALVWTGILAVVALLLGVAYAPDLLSKESSARMIHFIQGTVPAVILFALLVGKNASLRTASGVVGAAWLVFSGISATREERETARTELAPFDDLCQALSLAKEPAKLRIGTHDLRGLTAEQIRRRLQARGDGASRQVRLQKNVRRLADALRLDLVLTNPRHEAAFLKAGFERILGGTTRNSQSKDEFAAYLRRTKADKKRTKR